MMRGIESKTLELPDLGGQRLLVNGYSPVCERAERYLVQSVQAGRISEMKDVEIVVFLELEKQIVQIRERVNKVLIKSINCHNLDGEQNGIVLDPNSWLHGFLVHKEMDDLFLARPLSGNYWSNTLEGLYPEIVVDFQQGWLMRKKLFWHESFWNEAIKNYCISKYPGYGLPPPRGNRLTL